ncbi:hypothetical protein C8Q72DRAFT_258925 [Fomitopsis betulina]|nr:hypothetical protein C8Q72DRAFT_258925 [Fomitopsis betulina]
MALSLECTSSWIGDSGRIPCKHHRGTWSQFRFTGSAKKVVFVSSINGSLSWASDTATLSITYAATKAALNMLARKWGAVLYEEGIATVILHPGWVETEMGVTIKDWWGQRNPDVKPVSMQESIGGVLRIIDEAKPEKDVPFIIHMGKKLPW